MNFSARFAGAFIAFPLASCGPLPSNVYGAREGSQRRGRIQELPEATQERREWQIAVHCLIDVAEGRDFIMHARIGVLQALNRNKPQAIVEQRKAAKKYRIVR